MMSAISKIEVKITTGDNGTLGHVYLGLGGREFRLNRRLKNDFMRNDVSQFVLGDASHAFSVANPEDNDPRSPYPLDTADLLQYPIYLRLSGPNGHWRVEGGTIEIQTGSAAYSIDILPGDKAALLGPRSGEVLFIRHPS
jgi:hypothetical protein